MSSSVDYQTLYLLQQVEQKVNSINNKIEVNKELENKLEEIAKMLCLDPKEINEKGFYGRACSRLINRNQQLKADAIALAKFYSIPENCGYNHEHDDNIEWISDEEYQKQGTKAKEFLSKYPESI